MRRFAAVAAALLLYASVSSVAVARPLGATHRQRGLLSPQVERLREETRHRIGRIRKLSSGARMWLTPPSFRGMVEGGEGVRPLLPMPSFGSNVDANDPSRDLVAGQSETAIAAWGSNVVVAWNDLSGSLSSDPRTPEGSLTGVAFSGDGGRTFRDLVGLPNTTRLQMWSGDPTVVAFDENHFAVGSLYFPAGCRRGRPSEQTMALSVGTVDQAASTIAFGDPIVPLHPGNVCASNWRHGIAMIDKEFMAYDATSRTLAISYTRYEFGSRSSANGQIEVIRATVPEDPARLAVEDFSRRVIVWPEEPYCRRHRARSRTYCNAVNQGSYPAVAPNGDVYVAWERNILSNLWWGGDHSVYIHAALVPAGATAPAVGGPDAPVVLTVGQQNATSSGGVKSLDQTQIVGYSRYLGMDFPRIAFDAPIDKVIFVWNDASVHPLGDIWLRSADPELMSLDPIRRVNDDNSWALHFMPAVSVGSDGSIRTSWYDRRLWGADSSVTDYFGEIRPDVQTNAPDFRITTGETDWLNTGSLINPNFGDYTDSATTGTTTYYTWSDGRVGVPQPFVDRRS